MGRWLVAHPGRAPKPNSLVQTAYEHGVPIFCPAFSDSSAGFGLVAHQVERPDAHLTIDSVRDFRELTELKIAAGDTGLLMIGGGSPKNFAQDTVVCAEILGKTVPMHKYSVQITVADVRDGACSSSSLKEASSWGKVDAAAEQMVFAEATLALPLLAAYGYHNGSWQQRPQAGAGEAAGARLMVDSIINCATPEDGRRGPDLGALRARRLVRRRREPRAGGDRRLPRPPDRAVRAPHPDRARLPLPDRAPRLADLEGLAPAAMVARVAEAVAQSPRFAIVLGGIHSVTIGALEAHARARPAGRGHRACRSTPISTCATTMPTTTTTTRAATPTPA